MKGNKKERNGWKEERRLKKIRRQRMKKDGRRGE